MIRVVRAGVRDVVQHVGAGKLVPIKFAEQRAYERAIGSASAAERGLWDEKHCVNERRTHRTRR